jgi:hypothetical protein
VVCSLASTGITVASVVLLILFLLTPPAYCFLPTSIRTTVEPPLSTPTPLPFSGGETLEISTWFRAMAARICCANWLPVRFLMESHPPGVSTEIVIPADTLLSIVNSSLPRILYCGIPSLRGPDFALFHPADRNTSSMSTTKSKHSVSPQVPMKRYSVPLNILSGETTCSVCGSLRGVVSRVNSAVTAAARWRASFRCDSAASACFLADLISSSKESASWVACWAKAKAVDAEATALPDWSLASFAASAAPLADILASPAFFVASASKISSNFCTYPSALETKLSATNSPPTPTTINIQPTNASSFAHSGGCSSGGEKWKRRLKVQSPMMEWISCHSSGPSITSPTTTRNVAANNRANQTFLKASKSLRMRSSMPFSVSCIGTDGGSNIDFSNEDHRTDASLAHAYWRRRFLYDPQPTLGHVQSLAHWEGRA